MTEFERNVMFQAGLRQLAAQRIEEALPLVKPVVVVPIAVVLPIADVHGRMVA